MMSVPFPLAVSASDEAKPLREMILHLSVYELPEPEGNAVGTDDAPALPADALRCRDLQPAEILVDARICRRVAAALELKLLKRCGICRIQYMAQRMRRLCSVFQTRFRLDAGTETAQSAKLRQHR